MNDPSQGGSVICFEAQRVKANRGRPARRRILQYDLEEFLLLTREMRAAFRRWTNKRNELRKRIDAGEDVETGVHTIRVKRHTRRGDLVPVSYSKVLVR